MGAKAASDVPVPSLKATISSELRFLFCLAVSIGISALAGEPKLGGFAALGSFMALLTDTKDTLKSRLLGLLLTFVVLMVAAGGGLYLRHAVWGEWVALIIVAFGVGLISFAERFWWIIGKYGLVFLMISLFDFAPDLPAVEGYAVGFGLAGLSIVLTHFIFRSDGHGFRPMDELLRIEGGDRNSWVFAVLSAAILLFGVWSSKLIGLSEPAWVGITIVYLVNTDPAAGFKRLMLRIVGTFVGYLAAVLLYPYMTDHWLLGCAIVLSALGIPYFISRNYGVFSFFITLYILLVLDWLLIAYGGDGHLLKWRFYDTCYGAAVTAVGLVLIWIVQKLSVKKQSPV